MVLDVPHFRQKDPLWADEKVGARRQAGTISEIGCTLCCVAMVFGYHGIAVTPKELNDFLNANDGYTETGLLRWDKCVEYARGRVRLKYNGDPDTTLMDENLAVGNPLIVRVYLNGPTQHWVVVVGRSGRDYLVEDPLHESAAPVSLSRYGAVDALRVFEKVAAAESADGLKPAPSG